MDLDMGNRNDMDSDKKNIEDGGHDGGDLELGSGEKKQKRKSKRKTKPAYDAV